MSTNSAHVMKHTLICRVTLMRMVTKEEGSGASLLSHTQSPWQTSRSQQSSVLITTSILQLRCQTLGTMLWMHLTIVVALTIEPEASCAVSLYTSMNGTDTCKPCRYTKHIRRPHSLCMELISRQTVCCIEKVIVLQLMLAKSDTSCLHAW